MLLSLIFTLSLTGFGFVNPTATAISAPHCPADNYPYSIYEIVVVELKRREGFSSMPYADGEGWSIGYGMFYKDKKEILKYPITEEEASKLLETTLNSQHQYLKSRFPKYEKHELWALVSLSYNVGLKRIREDAVFWDALQSKNLKALKKKWLTFYSPSANKQFSRKLEWALFTNDAATIKEMHEEGKLIVANRYVKKKDFKPGTTPTKKN